MHLLLGIVSLGGGFKGRLLVDLLRLSLLGRLGFILGVGLDGVCLVIQLGDVGERHVSVGLTYPETGYSGLAGGASCRWSVLQKIQVLYWLSIIVRIIRFPFGVFSIKDDCGEALTINIWNIFSGVRRPLLCELCITVPEH